MLFDIDSTLRYSVTSPSTLIFNVEAAQHDCQKIIREEMQITPPLPFDSYTMPESGNRYMRLKAPEGDLTVSYRATAAVSPRLDHPEELPETPIEAIPLEIVPYLYPSRYCQSDLLTRLAQHEFGQIGPGHCRVTAICDWIHKNVEYLRGSSDARTSAFDTATQRAGVCRDFAHLGIAFCRALNIPARYVSGYAWQLDPPDFHAVFEAFLGDRWYLFDATRQAPPLDGVVRIGTGRDAAEVAFASIIGTAQPTGMEVSIAPAPASAGEAADSAQDNASPMAVTTSPAL